MADGLLAELRGGELHLTFDRPAEGNGATNDMARELAQLLRTAGERAHVVVLRANGPDFCTGRANAAPRGTAPGPVEALTRRRENDVIFDCYQSFRDCSVPVIGVVQGRALGFGCALAALCDITLASDVATFQVPEMNHKIVPTMVMSALVDRVAQKHMEYLVLTREIISAETAFGMGIVSRVVPAAQLDANVDALLATFAVTAKAALQAVKDYARVAYDMPLRGAVDFARNFHAAVNSSTSELQPPAASVR